MTTLIVFISQNIIYFNIKFPKIIISQFSLHMKELQQIPFYGKISPNRDLKMKNTYNGGQIFGLNKKKLNTIFKIDSAYQHGYNIEREGQILESILARVKKIKQRQNNNLDQNYGHHKVLSKIPLEIQSHHYSYLEPLKQPDFKQETQSKKQTITIRNQKWYDAKIIQQTSNKLITTSKIVNLLHIKPHQIYPLLSQYTAISDVRKKPNFRSNHRSSASQLSKEIKKQSKHQQMKQIKNLKQIQLQMKHLSVYKNRKKIRSTKKTEQKVIINVEKQEYFQFINLINWSNNAMHQIQTNYNNYRIFIDKGNNHQLVRNTIKKRFWWTILQTFEEGNLNFLWTQNRNLKFILNLSVISSTASDILTIQERQNRTIFTLDQYKKCIQNNQQLKIKLLPKNISNKQQNQLLFRNPRYLKMHNHLQFNWNLSNKKMLFKNLNHYYTKLNKNSFDYIPLTFHIKQYLDQQWLSFVQFTKTLQQNKIWIVKPAQNTNRGFGIQIFQNIDDIRYFIQKNMKKNSDRQRTYIIQQYLMPFLYNKRKFDLRCYILVTSINKRLKAYWYNEGYIRTSSKQFQLKNFQNKYIHLTNDAIQNKSDDYGRYQPGNKLSFQQFQKYLNTIQNKKYNFKTEIQPKMIQLAKNSIASTYQTLDFNHRQYTFQIFGLDFLIDSNFKVWLIEVNTNPCLQLSCPLLSSIIPNMLQNSFKIALDPVFPPPSKYSKNKRLDKNLFQNNKYDLIFDSQQIRKFQNNNIAD